jgi:hypothetical protein
VPVLEARHVLELDVFSGPVQLDDVSGHGSYASLVYVVLLVRPPRPDRSSGKESETAPETFTELETAGAAVSPSGYFQPLALSRTRLKVADSVAVIVSFDSEPFHVHSVRNVLVCATHARLPARRVLSV